MTLQMLTHSILQKSASVLFLNTEAQMISGVNLQHWIMTLILHITYHSPGWSMRSSWYQLPS